MKDAPEASAVDLAIALVADAPEQLDGLEGKYAAAWKVMQHAAARLALEVQRLRQNIENSRAMRNGYTAQLLADNRRLGLKLASINALCIGNPRGVVSTDALLTMLRPRPTPSAPVQHDSVRGLLRAMSDQVWCRPEDTAERDALRVAVEAIDALERVEGVRESWTLRDHSHHIDVDTGEPEPFERRKGRALQDADNREELRAAIEDREPVKL